MFTNFVGLAGVYLSGASVQKWMDGREWWWLVAAIIEFAFGASLLDVY